MICLLDETQEERNLKAAQYQVEIRLSEIRFSDKIVATLFYII